MVGVTGFEPAASTSQTQKHRFFASFCVLFRAFSSENRAFTCHKVHKFHTVRSCKWSRLWTDLNPILLSPPRTSRKLQPEVDFCCCYYTMRGARFQVPSRMKICDAESEEVGMDQNDMKIVVLELRKMYKFFPFLCCFMHKGVDNNAAL